MEADHVAVSFQNMTIQAVVSHVDETALVPAMHVLVTRVDYSVIRLEPIDLSLCLAIKEIGLVLNRIAVKRVVARIDEVIRADLIRIADIFISNISDFALLGCRSFDSRLLLDRGSYRGLFL